MRYMQLTCALIAAGLAVASPVLSAQPASSPASKPATKAPATAPATAPAPDTQPLTKPAVTTAPATQPATRPAVKIDRPATDTVRFNYHEVPYADVVKRFAQMANKPLIGDVAIDGKLTFMDAEPYTYEEALDTLNIMLSMRGFRLMEFGRFMQLTPLAKLPEMPLKIVRGLDKTAKMRGGEIVTVLLPLKSLEADAAAKAVVRMVSAYGSITPMPRGRGVIITDNLANIRRVNDMLSALDGEEQQTIQTIKTVVLENAVAADASATITKLFGSLGIYSKTVYSDRYKRAVPTPADAKDVVTASADKRTNAVLLVGQPDKIAMAEAMLKQLDTKEGAGDTEVRVFELKNAKAATVAKMLAELSGPGVRYVTGKDGRRYPIPVKGSEQSNAKVVADEVGNRIIVSGTPADIEKIAMLIEKLDKGVDLASGMKIFRLKNATAEQISQIVTKATGKPDSRGIYRSALQISADGRTNSLIVVGTPTDVKVAAGVIEELDRAPETDPYEIHVIQLKSGNAEVLDKALENLFASKSGHQAGIPGFRVEADNSSNSLMISVPPAHWKKVQEAIEKLTKISDAAAAPPTRVIQLKFADARELATTLRMLYPSTKSARYNTPGIVPVSIGYNSSSNSLVISANTVDLDTISLLVKSIDVEKAAETDPIRIVHLKSANADKVSEMLNKMLPPVKYGEAPKIFIQGDNRTKTLMIRASESNWKMLDDMIQKLDKLTAGQVETRVVQLKFARAKDLAETLKGIYSPSSSRSSSRSSYYSSSYSRYRSPSTSSTTTGNSGVPVTIAHNEDSNTLVISASPQDHEAIAALIQSIDVEKSAQINPIRIVSLKSGNANKVATMLQEMLPPKKRGEDPDVFIRGDEHTGALMIRAPESKWEMLNKLIATMDESIKEQVRETRLLPVQNISAAEIVTMLQQLYPIEKQENNRRRSYYDYYSPPAQPKTKDPNRVVVSAAPNDQALLVDAPKNKIEEIAQLIETLDKEAGSEIVETRIYTLKASNAVEIAASLTKLFAKQTKSKKGSV
ncbi:MAG: hypothetical protein HN350_11970, partial [Phycisphaerales bacterium]|nr:hypothetical protein [Phycisphaerales bacterium]